MIYGKRHRDRCLEEGEFFFVRFGVRVELRLLGQLMEIDGLSHMEKCKLFLSLYVRVSFMVDKNVYRMEIMKYLFY